MNEYYPQSPDQHSPQSGKLILPAYNDTVLPSSEDAKTAYIPMGSSASSPYSTPVHPELLMQNYEASSYASGKLKPQSHSNPAQLILLIAIVVVLIATGSVAYAAVTVIEPALNSNHSAATQASNSAASSRATTTVVATAMPSPTPSPTPITTFNGAPLTLRIEGLPHNVDNGDSGPVTVQTNAAGISVYLQVTYAAPPYNYTSATQITDANGTATLTWDVQINPSKRRTNAQVVAVAQEPDGKQVQSDKIDVRVFKD